MFPSLNAVPSHTGYLSFTFSSGGGKGPLLLVLITLTSASGAPGMSDAGAASGDRLVLTAAQPVSGCAVLSLFAAQPVSGHTALSLFAVTLVSGDTALCMLATQLVSGHTALGLFAAKLVSGRTALSLFAVQPVSVDAALVLLVELPICGVPVLEWLDTRQVSCGSFLVFTDEKPVPFTVAWVFFGTDSTSVSLSMPVGGESHLRSFTTGVLLAIVLSVPLRGISAVQPLLDKVAWSDSEMSLRISTSLGPSSTSVWSPSQAKVSASTSSSSELSGA